MNTAALGNNFWPGCTDVSSKSVFSFCKECELSFLFSRRFVKYMMVTLKGLRHEGCESLSCKKSNYFEPIKERHVLWMRNTFIIHPLTYSYCVAYMNTIWLTVQITQGGFDKLLQDYLIIVLLLMIKYEVYHALLSSLLFSLPCRREEFVREGKKRVQLKSGIQRLAPPKTIALQRASC